MTIGFPYNDRPATTLCPYCGAEALVPEYVDVGVGYVQVTPWSCEECWSMEIGPYDQRSLSVREQWTGWTEPLLGVFYRDLKPAEAWIIEKLRAIGPRLPGFLIRNAKHCTLWVNEFKSNTYHFRFCRFITITEEQIKAAR